MVKIPDFLIQIVISVKEYYFSLSRNALHCFVQFNYLQKHIDHLVHAFCAHIFVSSVAIVAACGQVRTRHTVERHGSSVRASAYRGDPWSDTVSFKCFTGVLYKMVIFKRIVLLSGFP